MGVPTAKQFLCTNTPLDREAWEACERAFFHSLRLRNGTFKTTYAHRLDDVNDVATEVLPSDRPLDIMDVAVSSGAATLEWMESLERAGIAYRMTAGDLSIRGCLLSFGRVMNVLVDGDGYPLQFDVLGKAIPYPPGRRRTLLLPPLFVLLQMLRWTVPFVYAGLFKKRVLGTPRASVRRFGIGCRPVDLISPRLANSASASVVEDDLLAAGSFLNCFHVVRAANVLNKLYFSDETLRRMAANLRRRLKPRGVLIICRTDEDDINHGTVFRLNEARRFEIVRRIGSGSEVESLVLELPASEAAAA